MLDDTPENIPPLLDILYQDDSIVAIHKPAGLMVHKSWIASDAKFYALQMVRDQIGQYVYPVHRLDRPTSGVLLFALNQDSARHLSEQFEQNKIQKEYLCVVRGITPEYGLIDHPLRPKADKLLDQKRSQPAAAQDAQTEYWRISETEVPFSVDKYPSARYSLVKVKPHQGRKHQIRRHMKHINHPIIGDPKHGKSRHNNFFKSQYDSHRLLLAATKISFTHPLTNKKLEIECPLAHEFIQTLNKLGLKQD